jgi:hypothetical protein
MDQLVHQVFAHDASCVTRDGAGNVRSMAWLNEMFGL